MKVFKRINMCFLLFIAGITLFWAGILMMLTKALPDSSALEQQQRMSCVKHPTEDVWSCKHY